MQPPATFHYKSFRFEYLMIRTPSVELIHWQLWMRPNAGMEESVSETKA